MLEVTGKVRGARVLHRDLPAAGLAICEFLVHPREVVPQDGPEGHCACQANTPIYDKYFEFLNSVYTTLSSRAQAAAVGLH